MKKIFASLISLLLVASGNPAFAEWRPDWLTEQDSYNRYFMSIADTAFGPKLSYLMARTVVSGQPSQVQFCDGLNGACDPKVGLKAQVTAGVVWDICSDEQTKDCINSVSLNSESASIKVLDGVKVAANTTYDLIGGSGPVEIVSQDGRTFLLFAKAEYVLLRERKYFNPVKLEVQIIPVLKKSGTYTAVPEPGNDGRESFNGPASGCLWNTATECWAESQGLSENDSISLDLNLSKLWSGFFKGRLDESSITVANVSGIQRVVVTGKPVMTQKIFFEYDPESLTQAQIDAVCMDTTWCQFETTQIPGIQTHLALSKRAIAIINAFREQHKDTSAASYLEWSFGNTTQSSQNCFSGNTGLTGMVTSNAPVYQSGPPTYAGGYLSYDVGGLHYQTDGKTLNLGVYNLTLRSDVARCIYGFSAAPVSATVQVLTDNGQEVNAVTTVGESDGWLKLSATGFTYSEKQIKVKISQPLKATVSKFSGTKTSLSSTQQAQVKKAVSKRTAGETVICKAPYKSPSQKSLALKRAKAACSYAKTVNRSVKTYATTIKTTNSTSVGKVLLSSK